VKCGSSNDHVSSNDGSAVNLSNNEDDWHSLQPLGVQPEDFPTCDSALKVFGVRSVEQVSDQHLTRAEDGLEEEKEVAEHKATFLDALKRLETARKCLCQFDTKTNITVLCNKVKINYTD
jgi:hypothetical protein